MFKLELGRKHEVVFDPDRPCDVHYYLNNIPHRKNGPAIEYTDGAKEWYLNGKRHREDGPACEWANGSNEWLIDGEYHREDGPAIDISNGVKYWYLNGVEVGIGNE